MEDVKLIGLWSSPFTQRVIWALKLKGISFTTIEEDIGNKSSLLLQYNPVHKKVPVLLHAGKPISESMLIVQYIDETWHHVYPMLPSDAYERSRVRFWAKFIDDKTIPMMNFFLYSGEKQEEAIQETLETLRTIENEGLQCENKVFGGDSITIADIALGWIVNTLVVMEDIVEVKFIDAHSFPRLVGWTERFKRTPVIKNNLPDQDRLLDYFKRRRQMFLKLQHHHEVTK